MNALESSLIGHARRLCKEIGARPLGSAGNHAAADYIRERLEAAGLQVERQTYPCTAWEQQAARLQVAGQDLAVEANAFSPACDVQAECVRAGSLAELDGLAAEGKLLFLFGELARAPLSPKSWFLKDARDEQVIQALERLRPAALLSPPTATEYYGQLTEDWELDLPAATLTPASALHLARHPGQPVHLCIRAERRPAEACNLVARRGAHKPRIVICAHFDTKINTPGASDNAGGLAVLLGLAEALPLQGLATGLEFVAFNGEEYLPMGDDIYVSRMGDGFADLLAAINLDGVGPWLGTTTLTGMAGDARFEAVLHGCLERHPGAVWTEPWPESNHSTFAMRGVPAAALSAAGTRSLAHSRADGIAQLSPSRLAESWQLVADLVLSLQDHPPGWGRPARD